MWQKRLMVGKAIVNATALGLEDARNRAQQRRLTATVAAYQRMDGAGAHLQVATPQHPVVLAPIAQMHVTHGDGRRRI